MTTNIKTYSDEEIQIIELAKKLGVKINIEDTKATLDNAFNANKNDTREMLRENVKLMDTKYFHNKFKNHVITNQKFLYTENSDCKNTIDNFMATKHDQVMIIKSVYGTGKSYCLNKILNKSRNTLIVTYRRSLAAQYGGVFPEFWHYNDNEGEYSSGSAIVQYDSLDKVKNGLFDYIVLDEIVALLNHMSSKFIAIKNKGNDLFTLLVNFCKNADKCFLLDADIDDAAKYFASIICVKNNVTFIENTYQSSQKRFFFNENYDVFKKHIHKDLTEDKNICIVSMSIKQAYEYEEYINDAFPEKNAILHTSKSNSEINKLLSNVNTEWVKYNVIIFTSVVEAGIDFNVPNHIYKIYVSLLSGPDADKCGCSQRSLLQMINRVRNPICNDIIVYTNGLKIKNNAGYNYSDICEKYGDAIDMATDNKTLLYFLLMNKMESENKVQSCFMNILVQLIEKKNHKWYMCDFKPDRRSATTAYMKTFIDLKVDNYDQDVHDMELNTFIKKFEALEADKILHNNKFKTEIDNKDKFKMYHGKMDNLYFTMGLMTLKHKQSDLYHAIQFGKMRDMDYLLSIVSENWRKTLKDGIVLPTIKYDDDKKEFTNEMINDIAMFMSTNKFCKLYCHEIEKEDYAIKSEKAFIGRLKTYLSHIFITLDSKRVGKDKKYVFTIVMDENVLDIVSGN